MRTSTQSSPQQGQTPGAALPPAPATAPGAPGPEAGRSRFGLWLALIVAAIGSVVAAGGAFVYRQERESQRALVARQLETLADLKVRQLIEWRSERLDDARLLRASPALAAEVAAFLAGAPEQTAAALVQRWLLPLRGELRYEAVLLVDRELRVLAASPAGATLPVKEPLLVAGMARNQTALGDLHRAPGDRAPHLDLLVPLGPAASDGASTAAIVLRIDPQRLLYPLLQSWAIIGPTAETLLVRREGDQVLFLNDLRHQPDTALKLRRPLAEPLLPAAMAARGHIGIFEARDYRGVPVLAAIRPVEGSPWYLVAKVDQAEAYASLRVEARSIAVTVALTLAALATAAAYLWRHHREQMLRRTLAAEREARVLAERLALQTKYANDMIVLADASLHILDANARALQGYRYSFDEIRQLDIADLRPPETRPQLAEHLARLRATGGAIFESLQQRADRTVFVAEVSSRYVELGGETFFLEIVRDITERRQAEAALRQSEELYRNLFETNHAAMLLLDPETGAVADANPAACAFYGWSREQLQRMAISDINPLAASELKARMALARATQCNHFLFQHRRADGTVRDVEVFSGPLMIGGRSLLYSIIHDITERKAAEAALRESEERLRLFIQHAPASLAMFDLEMRYIDASRRWRADYGLTQPTLRGLSHYEVFPEIDDRWKEIHRRALQGEVVTEEEDRFLRADGGVQWLRWEVRPWFNAAGAVGGIVIFSEDITARKHAEQALAAQMEELRRWHAATLGREARILELKAEVNRLLVAAGQPPRYASREEQPAVS